MDQNLIFQYEPMITEKDSKAVSDYLSSGAFITEYKQTREFESKISSFSNSEEAIIFPNGTLTLYAILKCLGIEKGAKVVVPNYTMAATAFAPAELNCEIIFCDVEIPSFCICLKEFEKI